MISKAFESIEENIKSIPDISVKKVIDKGKGVMSAFSEETNRKQSCVEETMEDVQDLDCKNIDEENRVPFPEITKKTINQEVDNSDVNMRREEETNISNLKKALQHYKTQNSYLNHLNDQLVNENRMIR